MHIMKTLIAEFHVVASGSGSWCCSCHDPLGHLNRTEPLLMSLVTPLPSLLQLAYVSSLVPNPQYTQILHTNNTCRCSSTVGPAHSWGGKNISPNSYSFGRKKNISVSLLGLISSEASCSHSLTEQLLYHFLISCMP